MEQDEKYIKDLEETVSKFMKPLKNVPFSVIIKALSGYSVVVFDRKDKKDIELLKRLSKGLAIATRTANTKGIFSGRPNEVGNHIEPFVRDALNRIGMKAHVPTTGGGKHKAAGYPDVEIEDVDRRITYLECKTYNLKSEDSSFRSFYFQPSTDFKITSDARHLLVGFEIKKEKRNGKEAYVPISWHLYTLDKLHVQVKYEFNASNRELYVKEALLAEGKV